jgi:hypothetical protein
MAAVMAGAVMAGAGAMGARAAATGAGATGAAFWVAREAAMGAEEAPEGVMARSR